MRITSVLLRTGTALLLSLAVVSIATLSAHMVKGLQSPTAAKAFVSSPSGGADALLPIKWGTQPAGDPNLRVGCFFVANSSAPRADRTDYPRVTGAGFELPGSPSGFALLEPLDG